MDKFYEREIKDLIKKRVDHMLETRLKELDVGVTIGGRRVDIEKIEISDGSIYIDLCSPLFFPDTNEEVSVMKTQEKP